MQKQISSVAAKLRPYFDGLLREDAETGGLYLHDDELGDFPGHVLLLVRAGIYIFENMTLDELGAHRCREFLFVAAPLKFEGATAGPVRPLAIGRAG